MGGKTIVFSVLVGLLLGCLLYWGSNTERSVSPTRSADSSPEAGERLHGDRKIAATAEQAAADREVASLLVEYAPKSGPERAGIVAKLAEQPQDAALKAKLLAILEHEQDEKVKAQAVRAAGLKFRSDPQVVAALTQCLAGTQGDPVREAATESVRDLEEAGRGAVGALVELLAQDEHRISALEVLAGIGPAADGAVKPVAGYLTSKRVQERKAALKTLARIGKASAAVLGNQESGIVACLKDQDPIVRAEAAHCLKRIGKDAQRADIKGLLEPLLKDADEGVRRAAEGAYDKLFSGA